jgi:hypothetical protein
MLSERIEENTQLKEHALELHHPNRRKNSGLDSTQNQRFQAITADYSCI